MNTYHINGLYATNDFMLHFFVWGRAVSEHFSIITFFFGKTAFIFH